MRSLVRAAAILATTVSALVIPTPSQAFNSPNDITTVAGTTVSDHVSIKFAVPCKGCFDGSDEELEFEVDITSSARECHGPAPIVNGVPISTQGRNTFTASTISHPPWTRPSRPRQVSASWEIECLKGEASLLSFTVEDVGPESKSHEQAGFSISFTQHDQPRVIRLQNIPVQDLSSPDLIESWMSHEPATSGLSILTETEFQAVREVQHAYMKLEHIKAQIGHMHHELRGLHHEYAKQEQKILSIIQQDFRACGGVKCMLSTAFNKAPQLLELVKAHFRHRPKCASCSRDRKGMVEKPMGMKTFDVADLPPHPPFEHPEDGPQDHPPPPQEDHSRPPFEHGDHPPHHRPDHPRPHFRHHHHHKPWMISISSFIILALILGLVFRIVKTKTTFFRDPRTRADRAARREDRRTRAAYRRAACRHKWNKWWSQFRKPESTADYEEKRARIIDQEDQLEDVMQSEIQDLRRAHELVGELMRAEEGRQRMYHEINFGSSSRPAGTSGPLPAELGDGVRSSGVSVSSLPIYQPPPPSYEEELDDDLAVVDGFRYTPSNSDTTPASSVVDCNSRISFESGYPTTKNT